MPEHGRLSPKMRFALGELLGFGEGLLWGEPTQSIDLIPHVNGTTAFALERRGLVVTEPDPDGSLVYLTEEGREVAHALAFPRPAAKLPCQVCGKLLTPRRDGRARPHGRYGGCQGAGYRLARWPVGQRLRHHSSGVWTVIEDRGGPYGDYVLRCVEGQRSPWRKGRWIEEPGTEMVAHGEYMHRHGWTPVSPAGEETR